MGKSDNEAREQRILDAAATLFTHYGYDKTTVSDIAQEAGVSKGAIYLHFESKDDLFEALLMREIEKYTENWLELIEADPRGGTMAGVYKNTLYALNQSPFMSAIFKQDRHIMGNYVRKPGNLFQDRKNQSMRHEFLKMMQDAGAVRQDIDPKVTAHIMNMLAYGLVGMDEVMHADDIPPTDDIIEAIADMMDKALTPPDGGNSEAGKAIIRQILTASSPQMQHPLNSTSK
jgi:AcrR family transcriptional regulator